MSLKGGQQLRSRIRSLGTAFKDVGKRWGDRAKTEMGREVPVKTGRLRRSFRARSTTKRARVTGHYSAYFVDAGTKPHDITPRRGQTLAWSKGGRTIFAKRTQHPGVRARPFRSEAARRALSETAGADALIEAWNRGA